MAAAWVKPPASICSRTTRATFSTLARSPGLSGPTPGRLGGTTWICASIIEASDAHHVVTAVHEQRVAANGAGQRAAQEDGGVGHFFRLDPARQRRRLGRVGDRLLEFAGPDAASGPRGVWPGRD